MNPAQASPAVRTFLLYALSFFLVWEWLRPVEQLTDTDFTGVFLGFVFLSLLLAFLKAPAVPVIAIKLIYVFFTIQFIYYGGSFFSPAWVALFFSDVQSNTELLWSKQWVQISDPFQTLLFFVLLWMITYLLRYWLISSKTILFFFFMTIVLITVLDAFSPYEADAAIVRTMVMGLTMMGILTFNRMAESGQVPKTRFSAQKWMASLLVLVSGSVLLAFAAPKAEPVWPDPVPYLASLNSSMDAAIHTLSQSGFRSDDSELGGPFQGNDALVFRAEVEKAHYWTVETRDMYTGKGWVSSDEAGAVLGFTEQVPDALFSFSEEVPSETLSSTVYNEIVYTHIQYPLGLERIDAAPSYFYNLNKQTNQISSFDRTDPKAPAAYTVQYDKPSFEADALRESSAAGDDRFPGVARTYTQLPDSLPSSVGELAREITAGKNTAFDKAKAIEAYFGENGFVYDQVNVAVPGEGEDYVAQFLFETKRGYCDNYSTSMAVMLRTLDIPARWVKGYTAGTYVELTENGNPLYEVTNKNAHSWVEVYFPGTGWVPFEPTQGFSNSTVPQLEEEPPLTSATAEDSTPAEEPDAPLPVPDTPEPETAQPAPEENAAAAGRSSLPSVAAFLQTSGKFIVLAASALFFLAAVSYKYRRKWLPFYYISKYKKSGSDGSFPEAYRVLLAQLGRSGLKRRPGQTLRAYAKEIDAAFASETMSRLTSEYEQFAYKNSLPEGTWNNTKKDWEAIMKKTAVSSGS